MRSLTGGRHRGRCFVAALAVAALAVSMPMLSGAQPPVETYRPAPAPGSHVVTWEGDPEFCPRLIRNAHRIEQIQPILGPDNASHLLIGDAGEHLVRLYITQRKFPNPTFYQLYSAKDWLTLLGYRPPAADITPGRIINEPRWREIDNVCTGILQHPEGPTEPGYPPRRISLYQIDVDGDGVPEQVTRKLSENYFDTISIINFKTCYVKRISSLFDNIEILKFENIQLIEYRLKKEILLFRLLYQGEEIGRYETEICSFRWEFDGRIKSTDLGKYRTRQIINKNAP